MELIGDIIFADGKDGKDFKAAADKYGIGISEILAQRDYVVLDEGQRKGNIGPGSNPYTDFSTNAGFMQ